MTFYIVLAIVVVIVLACLIARSDAQPTPTVAVVVKPVTPIAPAETASAVKNPVAKKATKKVVKKANK